jgi:carboxymethylenebutenolidase
MAMGRDGSEVQFEKDALGGSSETLRGYFSQPASGRGRGILVIHESWGLTDHTRDVCDRLARAGFASLAPDLFGGRTAEDRAAAQQLAKELDTDRAIADVDAAVAELHNQNATEGSRIGALGFELGGSLALAAGCRSQRIGAVVSFYAANPTLEYDFANLKAPVLAIFAGEDESVTESVVQPLESALQRAGVRSSVQVRTDVKNGYMNDAQPDVYDATAATEGWDALLAFFRAELA